MQEMTIQSPSSPNPAVMASQKEQGEEVESTCVDGVVGTQERIIHHQQSKSEENRLMCYNLPPCHKQTRSDEILNHSGPPPVPTNSPQSDCGGGQNRNNLHVSIGKPNSKSMENLPQASYAVTNSAYDNKIHKCASQENMQMSRVNCVHRQNVTHDLSMSVVNNSSSGVSIMENLVREFGLQPKSLAREPIQRQQSEERGPPPKYPGTQKTVNVQSDGSLPVTSEGSDPRATSCSGELLNESRSCESMRDSVTSMGSSTSPHADSELGPFEIDHEAIATRATQMAEILSDENVALRQELDMYYQKVNRLQKFEQDIHKVQAAHDMLVESTKKREQLEAMVRGKLEAEGKKLHNQVTFLQAHLEITKGQLASREQAISASDFDLRLEITKRDALLTQLAGQHKEELGEKQRMAVELGAQRATLNDQRSHIDVLDTALSNAQANVVKLQEELKRRQPYVEKVGILQKCLQTLQASYQKRDHLEQKYRQKLERELATLKGHHSNQDEGVSEMDGGNSSQTLVELLREREDTILRLETDVTKWEQRYLEEFTMRLCAGDLANQDHSQTANQEAEAQAEKVRHLEELQYVNVKLGELEAKINGLTAELAQKDMIIEMLRRQLMEKDGIISSMEKLSRPMSSSSPQSSQQNIRKSSIDSMHSLAFTPGSSNSLQNLMQRSPVSSQQNLVMRSPNGSHQSLAVLAPSRGPGSQERLLALSDSFTSLSTSGLSTAGTDGSDTDLAKERQILDEKLKLLDQEIAQQDRILESLW